MLPASQSAARPKRRIGKYLVTGRIGRGGMGMVYRGYDEVLDRTVAIKTLTIEGTLDEESRRRFEIEAKSAARLQHQNIVTVYELGEDRACPFIAMELLPGADLLSLMRSGDPLTLQEKLDCVIQVCRGLAYAHEHGIVHRDIKPANIHLLDDGTVKIMDFGIAKLGGTSLTKSGMMVGTVHYMSPEQIRASPLDGRSDVFSLGVILYELLAGRRPFAGEDTASVLYKIVHAEPEPLQVDLGPLGERLGAIVARALARNRDDRYASANAFAEALSELLAEHVARHLSTATAADLDAIAAARRLAKEGQLDEAQKRLDLVIERSPESTEARRAQRALNRERARRMKPAEPETDDFPELDATFQSPQTGIQPETAVAPTVAHARPAAPVAASAALSPRGAARGLVIAAAVALVVAIGAGLLLTRHPAPSPSAPRAAAPAEAPSAVAAPRSNVPDNPPAPAPTIVAVAPPGSVEISSAYPIDVLWKGKVVAQGQTAAKLSLPAGRQTLALVSDKYFLRASVQVDVKAGGTASLAAPQLGRISIQANPDNCEVAIDGVFVDYPPILNRAVAAGTRSVTFKWPDGTRREQSAEIPQGGLVYVTGRKD